MSNPICVIPQVAVFCGAADVVKSAAHTALSGTLGSIASSAVNGEVELLKTLTTAFLGVPTPNLSSATSSVAFLQGSLQWLVVAVATLSLIIAAGRMAWQRKGQPASEALAGILRLVVVTGAGVAAISLLTGAGDVFSTWILGQSTADPSGQISAIGALSSTAFSSPVLILVLAVLAIIGILLQIALLLVRSALLVVLAGVWPLSAAASMSPAGSQWFKKTTGWLLAFILYKPAAAIIYAAAFRLMTHSATGLGSIEGVILLVMATLALPALMRFVVPMVAAAGGVGTGEAVGAAAGVAVGAAMIAGSGGISAMAARGGSTPGLVAKGAAGGGGPGGRSADGATMAAPFPAASPAGGGGTAPGSRGSSVGAARAAGGAVHGALTLVPATADKVTDGAPAS